MLPCPRNGDEDESLWRFAGLHSGLATPDPTAGLGRLGFGELFNWEGGCCVSLGCLQRSGEDRHNELAAAIDGDGARVITRLTGRKLALAEINVPTGAGFAVGPLEGDVLGDGSLSRIGL